MLASDAISHIQHTLASTLADDLPGASADARAINVLNEAGRWMCGMHRWRWLDERTATLGVTASQNYIDLPLDFGRLIYAAFTDTPNRVLLQVSLGEILDARLRETGQSQGHRVAVSWKTDTNQRKPLLELDYTPGSTDADAITMVYTGWWEDLAATGDTVQLPVDGWMDLLYIQICRAFARGWEEEDSGLVDQRLALIATGPVFKAAVDHDGMIQFTRGQMRNTAVQMARRYTPTTIVTDFNQYTGPS